MYITINKKDLTELVMKVVRFTERRSISLPVLGAVVITAEKEQIHIQATNLETSIDVEIEGSIKKTGTVALPAQVLREITSSFSGNGTVSFEQVNDTVVLSGEGIKSVIKTVSAEDFPTRTSPSDAKIKTTLSGNILQSLIAVVAPYASLSTVRPELASILLRLQGGTLTAVATDSFGLAEKKVSLEGNSTPFSILIPAKNALLLSEILPDTTVELYADDHQCSFVWSGGQVMTRLVASEYPDYAQIIPKTFIANATVLKKDFEQALKRTAIFSDSFQKIKLAFASGKKQLTLSSRNTEVGETTEQINASVEGEEIELSFNHRYVQAPLASIQNESITLSASGIGRPLVIKSLGDNSFLYLVMPMNQ